MYRVISGYNICFLLIRGMFFDQLFKIFLRIPLFLFRNKNNHFNSKEDIFLSILFRKKQYALFKTDSNNFIVLRLKDSSDEKVLIQVFVDIEYKLLCEKLKEIRNVNFVDAGGNIGLTSIYLSNYCDINRGVIIEPDRQNIELIKINFLLNNIKNIEIRNAALWSDNSFLKIDNSFRDGKEWSISVKPIDDFTKDTQKIKTITIQMLLEYFKYKIDAFKIDIEGSEKEIFKHVSQNIGILNNIKMISVEVHEEVVSIDDIRNVLISENYSVYYESQTLYGFR